MAIVKNLIALCGACVLAACVQQPTARERQLDEARRLVEEYKLKAAETTTRQTVNENWRVGCSTDQVTTVRRCFAGTFGKAMGSDGQPLAHSQGVPFQIYYLGDTGPIVMVGLNTYPGRDPMVRIDDGKPIVVKAQPNPEIVSALRTGLVVRGRYHVWPRGSTDVYVELDGINEALERLDRERATD